MSKSEGFPKEKKWKQMYGHSEKIIRANQLGFDYPRMTNDQLLTREEITTTKIRQNILFICSKNQWRSPTAETIFKKHPLLNVKSAGTSTSARHTVSIDDLRWADQIMVMEEKHKSRLTATFKQLLKHKPIYVLDIPDDYPYMDPELITLLTQAMDHFLDTQ